jgi:two-component system, chemotaxis family, chemotaxis protein CheV
MSILIFQAGNSNLLSLDLLYISEVMKIPELHNYPDSSPYMAGVANVRDVCYPVIDLPKLMFGIEVETSTCTMLILHDSVGAYAIKVSEVDQIINDVEKLDHHENRMKKFTREVITLANGRLTQALDLDRIIDKAIGQLSAGH